MESVDTVKVILNDFRIEPGAKLDIQLGIRDFATGEIRQQELYSDGHSLIEGSKAIQNTLNYQFTLQDLAVLQLSLPKVLHNTNSTAIVDGQQASQAFMAVEKELASNGIHTNIKEASLSRLDIFRQQRTRFAFTDYSPVFTMLTGTRQNKRDYGTTYLFYNTRREVAFYDKEVEEAMRARKELSLISPSNLVRAEARLLRKQTINNAGLVTVDNLVKEYPAIEAVYKKEMAGVLRNNGSIDGQLCLALNGIEQEFVEAKRIYGRLSVREITRIMARYGIEQLLALYGLDNVVEMAQKYSDTKNKREVKRKLLRHIQEVSIGAKAIPNKLKELFDELYVAFAV